MAFIFGYGAIVFFACNFHRFVPHCNTGHAQEYDDEMSGIANSHELTNTTSSCLFINDKYFGVSGILHYDPDKRNPCTDEIGVLKINDTLIDIKEILHNFTLKSKGNEGCRPRIYPHPSLIADLNPVVIDNTTFGEVVQIKFNGDMENYVFFASQHSECPMLCEIYDIYLENRIRIMQIVEIMRKNELAWVIDTLAGGTYIPCGIGMRGGTKDSRPDLPFLLKSGKYLIIKELVDIYAKILGKQAKLLCKYCPNDYDENKRIYKEGDEHRCIFPTRTSQQGKSQDNDDLYWCLNQVAIRIMGGENENSNQQRDDERIAWHVDDNDVQSKQPLTFLPIGYGTDSGGGYVPDSDLMVFEHNRGGKCYRLKTSIADTVVFVFMNSGTQLHGSAKELISKDSMNLNYSLRFIPYGRRNILGFVKRKTDNSKRGEVFLDVKLKEHTPLNRNKVNVGDRVMMCYGKTKQKHLATIVIHDGKKFFRYDDNLKYPCGNLKMYSAECYEHIPSECTHCNPR